MQCRNALRQHAPGCVRSRLSQVDNTDQYIWTTDAVLAEAFARFVKVSRSQRRYESRVPGPLESRRRLAKRQYGLTNVTPSQNVNPALFGDYSVLDNTGVFKWQAPTPQAKLTTAKTAPKDGTASWWPSWMDKMAKQDSMQHNEYKQESQDNIHEPVDGELPDLLHNTPENTEVTTISVINEISGSTSEHSKTQSVREATATRDTHNAIPTQDPTQNDIVPDASADEAISEAGRRLDALLEKLEHIQHINMEALEDVIKFMSSSHDHAKLSSCKRLLTCYLPARSIDEVALKALCDNIIEKYKNGTILSTDLAFIIKSIRRSVACQDNPRLDDLVLLFHTQLAHHIRSAPKDSRTLVRHYKQLRAAMFSAVQPEQSTRFGSSESILFAAKVFEQLAYVPGLRYNDSTLAENVAKLLARIPCDGNSIELEPGVDKVELITALTAVINSSTDHTLLTAVVRYFMADEAVIRVIAVDGSSHGHDQYCNTTLSRVDFWLRCAHQSRALSIPHTYSVHSWAVYREIAQYFQPGELRTLNWISKHHLALALLSGWVISDPVPRRQPLKEHSDRSNVKESRSITLLSKRVSSNPVTSRQSSEAPGDALGVRELRSAKYEELRSLQCQLEGELLTCFNLTLRLSAHHSIWAVPNLLHQLRRMERDYETLLSYIVEAQSWSVILRYRILEQVLDHKGLKVSDDLIITMMMDLAAEEHYHLAVSLMSRLSLGSLPKLSGFIEKLCTTERFYMIIRTLDEALLHEKCDVRLIRGLVERLALAIAEHNDLTEQMAFRRVWVCYCFTRAIRRTWPSSDTDPHSHIARAFIRTAVIQRIQKGKYLSKERITYIIDKVRELEGGESAGELDQMLYVLQQTLVQQQKNAVLPHGSKAHASYVPGFAKELTAEVLLENREVREVSATSTKLDSSTTSSENAERLVISKVSTGRGHRSAYIPVVREHAGHFPTVKEQLNYNPMIRERPNHIRRKKAGANFRPVIQEHYDYEERFNDSELSDIVLNEPGPNS